MTTIRVYDINWFYNYGDHSDYMTKKEYDKIFNEEPTEMIIDISDWGFDNPDVEEIEDALSEYISNESGYYHEGFSWEYLVESETNP